MENLGYSLNSPPVFSGAESILYSSVSPSTVHVSNTGIAFFFRRYLMQKVLSVFEWTIPEEWDKDYFLYTVYLTGRSVIFRHEPFGIINQNCSLTGFNLYYRPTNAIVSNANIPSLTTLDLKIGVDCELVKLTPDYHGIIDLISYYADMLALCAESAGMNLVNSKLAYVFAAQKKAGAESFKKLFDKIQQGEPAVVIDRDLLGADGKPTWEYFSQNLKQNFIIPDILLEMRKIEMQFDAAVGIPTANTEKRANLTEDEVNVNNFENRAIAYEWMDCLTISIKKVKTLFPELTLAVKWNPEAIENMGGAANDDNGYKR